MAHIEPCGDDVIMKGIYEIKESDGNLMATCDT